jgi:hypothetical protein
MSYKEAGQTARTVLKEIDANNCLEPEAPAASVLYPLGLERRRVQSYKVIKPFAFPCRTPRQRTALDRALERLADQTGCGPELLALRRSSPERRQGSITAIVRDIYTKIRSGELNFSKALNLSHVHITPKLKQTAQDHQLQVQERKAEALDAVIAAIDEARMPEAVTRTGLFVRLEDINRLAGQPAATGTWATSAPGESGS